MGVERLRLGISMQSCWKPIEPRNRRSSGEEREYRVQCLLPRLKGSLMKLSWLIWGGRESECVCVSLFFSFVQNFLLELRATR